MATTHTTTIIIFEATATATTTNAPITNAKKTLDSANDTDALHFANAVDSS